MSQRPSDLGQKPWAAVKPGLFKTKAKKAEAENKRIVRWTSILTATSEYEKALDEPHHSDKRKQPDRWYYAR